MAKRKWTIKSYNQYIKYAKKRGLTLQQSRTSYRQMRGRLGRPVFADDIDRRRKDFREVRSELLQEQDDARELYEELLEDQGEGLQTLFDRHYGEEGYNFDLQQEILKVSIQTTKTRKHFSVRIG